ncbi:pimelyl-ACP methyl ester esterase BioV [Sulfurimonas paralvinellae]|uniref:Pimelyl-ACP methyl ester esterase BioV n=1 Tax=Sulfurimonas paralvinellae TaxID=317658 RepID=A0A7M1B765_9BACT|nr:pimelyl-ACP methyl ester esterase BioV [Sulfurimonas paralvinellae]QOP45589.1 pimelyl-ACP methyl ester esterase BioV [Sulfurimonas paralvinellae]
MRFFSGFSLQNEQHFFTPFIKESDYSVCGFSYGAIKAFEYVQKALREGKRVDTLQLFSPAFFQSKDEKFKRLQLMAYRKNEDAYLAQFINACFLPYERQDVARSVTVIEELEELLNYEWNFESLRELCRSGVAIEVYLGGKDQIVDADAAKEFFLDVATVTYIKDGNHFLLTL